jgi:hypothetical protein
MICSTSRSPGTLSAATPPGQRGGRRGPPTWPPATASPGPAQQPPVLVPQPAPGLEIEHKFTLPPGSDIWRLAVRTHQLLKGGGLAGWICEHGNNGGFEHKARLRRRSRRVVACVGLVGPGHRPGRPGRPAGAVAVVAVPVAAVLIRDCAPSPEGQRLFGDDAEHLQWVDSPAGYGAQVLPVVAKIEYGGELLSGPEPAEPDGAAVQRSFRLFALPPPGRADRGAVGQGELVQVIAVPPGEGIIDRIGELLESRCPGGGEYPSRPRPRVPGVRRRTAGGRAGAGRGCGRG